MADDDRGGRWVAGQFALIALTFAAAWLPPGWPEGAQPYVVAVGAVLALLGAAGVAWGWRSLGSAASPFPRPAPSATIVERGPYEFVRHPIYASALLFFIGFALATSPAVVVPLALLALLWRNKAALEEDLLTERFPHYVEYRRRVRGAFIPRTLRAD